MGLCGLASATVSAKRGKRAKNWDAEISRTGSFKLQQFVDGRWMSTMIGGSYVHQIEAEDECARLNEIQPGRWRVKQHA